MERIISITLQFKLDTTETNWFKILKMQSSSSVFVFGAKEAPTSVKPHCVIKLKDQIYALQWSPYDWCQDLICIAYTNNIAVASCKLNVSTI